MADQQKFNKRLKGGAILLVIGLLIAFVAFLLMLRSNGISRDVIKLDRSWSVIYKGQKTAVENLSNYTFPQKIKAGDSLVFESGAHLHIPWRAVLRIRSYHNAIAVYENEKLVYKYDTLNTGTSFIGSGYHYVYLDPNEENPNLKVVFVEQVNNRKITVSSFDLLPVEYVLSDFPARHIFALVVGIFLVLFGILAVLVGAVTLFYNTAYFRALMIGFLSFLLGTWTLCYTKVIQTVSFNFGLNTTLEYFCLYLSALPFTLLLWNMHKSHLSRIQNACFKILIAYEIAFTTTTTFLHLNSIVFYPRTLVIFHVSVVVGFALFISAGTLYSKKVDAAGRILTQGVAVFGLSLLVDLVRFHLNKAITIDVPLLDMTVVPIGTLILVLLLVQSYIIHLFYILEDRAEKGVLATMAYIDSLTGLYNRAKCQQIFELLDKGFGDYAVVSIDMNGLKVVNDEHGHNEGDRFIKTFATVLKEAFTGIGTTIREGGDEFLAIVRSEHVADVGDAVAKMNGLMKKKSAELPIPLEAAYGIAFKHELLKNAFSVAEESRIEAEMVYRLADKRMYAMKAKMKSEYKRQ